MEKNTLLTTFNDVFISFITDVQNVFPEDADLLSAKGYLLMIRKANPKMIVKIWKKHISSKYKEQILSGDLEFFIEKDYVADIQNNENSKIIADCIDRLREPIRTMTKENQQKSMQYIQNLTKLSDLIIP